MSTNEQPPTSLEDGFTVRRVGLVEFPEVVEFPMEETYLVGLAEDEDGGGRNLIFQLAYTYDEQDVRLGQDTYCITDEVAAVVYGGVTACVLDGRQLYLHFTPEAAEELDLPKECRLRLEVDQQSLEQLRHGLRKVFTDQRESPDPLVL
jgi:hypothetical protein